MIEHNKDNQTGTNAPAIVDAVNFNLQLKPYKKFTLKNGVEVYTIDAGQKK